MDFLADMGTLADGTRWKRRSHEPWFLDVYAARGKNAWEERIKDIPGVGTDGYRRCWVMPEEVFVLYVKGATG